MKAIFINGTDKLCTKDEFDGLVKEHENVQTALAYLVGVKTADKLFRQWVEDESNYLDMDELQDDVEAGCETMENVRQMFYQDIWADNVGIENFLLRIKEIQEPSECGGNCKNCKDMPNVSIPETDVDEEGDEENEGEEETVDRTPGKVTIGYHTANGIGSLTMDVEEPCQMNRGCPLCDGRLTLLASYTKRVRMPVIYAMKCDLCGAHLCGTDEEGYAPLHDVQ